VDTGNLEIQQTQQAKTMDYHVVNVNKKLINTFNTSEEAIDFAKDIRRQWVEAGGTGMHYEVYYLKYLVYSTRTDTTTTTSASMH